MKRGIFYIIGIVGLVLLTALTLPRINRMEAREAPANGQSVTFVYGADTARPDYPAFTMTEPLSGGLRTRGTVTRISIDQTSLNAMIYLLRGLHGVIPSALLLGVGCGFAERWISRKRRRTA